MRSFVFMHLLLLIEVKRKYDRLENWIQESWNLERIRTPYLKLSEHQVLKTLVTRINY